MRRPRQRLIKTELVLPEQAAKRVLVVLGMFVGGLVAVAMVALVSVFLFETVRSFR